MRLAGVVLVAFATVPPAGAAAVAPELLAAAQRLAPTTQLDPVLRAAACVFADSARHLDPLPAALAWTRPEAITVFAGLDGQPKTARAVLMRPSREMMARLALRELVASGGAVLFDHTLAPLPRDAPRPTFLALLVPVGTEPPTLCSPRNTQ
jgi:hypothetical protein